MSEAKTTEAKTTDVLRCEHCGNKGRLDVTGEYTRVDGEEHDLGGRTQWEYMGEMRYRMVVCPVCSGVMVINASAWQDDVKPFTTLYPTTVQYPASIPELVLKALKEANEVRHNSPNAYGVMAGRAIERICADKNCIATTLEKKIEELAKRGEIPDRLSNLAHQLRAIRNFGAHGGEGDLTLAEIPVIEAILRVIVEYIYSLPDTLKTAETIVAKLKK